MIDEPKKYIPPVYTWQRLLAHLVLLVPIYLLLSTIAPKHAGAGQMGGPVIGNALLVLAYLFVALLVTCFEFVTCKKLGPFDVKRAFAKNGWLVVGIVLVLYGIEFLRGH